MVIENSPDLWRSVFPQPAMHGHKYDRGHTVLLGSDDYTGATRLAAEAASRIGSGLVTVLSQTSARIYRATLPPDIMISDGEISALNRTSVLLAGPGGCNDHQAKTVMLADGEITRVLDADAIRLHADLEAHTCILTPHEGEFERFIGPIGENRTLAAAAAAESTGHIIVLKGPETIIAGQAGRLVSNTTSSPYLAKAGTGDVLAGFVAGLVAQGMPPFEAACAAVWMHGRAGLLVGPGLVPQDLMLRVPELLKDVLA